MRCVSCGSLDVEYDVTRGSSICTVCGTILSESSVVSEVAFSDATTSGLSAVVGTFVSHTSVGTGRGLSLSARRGGGIGGSGFGRDSREQTLTFARRIMQTTADTLRLRPHHVESAHRIFHLAVQNNFIQGRRTRNVIAACLYAVCRREKSPHLLLDFSDALQTNLYVLGATFLQLIRLLALRLPIIDPSLFIHRFAAQLQLRDENGHDKSHVVAMTALRLVARMKRDWLQVGRRPSGICGACLLIACRLHGFRRSQKEMLAVVHICEATLRSRMSEFAQSESAQMTFDQFERFDEDEHGGGILADGRDADGEDPPSFKRAQAKKRARSQVMATANSLQPPPLIGTSDDESMKAIDNMSADLSNELKQMLQKKEFSHFDGPIDIQPNGDMSDAPTDTNMNTNDADDVEDEIRPVADRIETLSDVDDAELDEFVLNDAESALRMELWDKANSEWTEAQRLKKLLKAEENKNNSQNETPSQSVGAGANSSTSAADTNASSSSTVPLVQPPLKESSRGSLLPPEGSTAVDAAMRALKGRSNVSDKINYDVLNGLLFKQHKKKKEKPANNEQST